MAMPRVTGEAAKVEFVKVEAGHHVARYRGLKIELVRFAPGEHVARWVVYIDNSYNEGFEFLGEARFHARHEAVRIASEREALARR